MKTFILLLAVVFAFSSCEKQSDQGNTLRGKLVISDICAHYVVQVLSATDSATVNNWADSKRNATFSNVFTVFNVCDFGAAQIKEGEEFDFVFDPAATPSNCATCLAAYPVPPKRYSIKVIK
jgi:hypothetical protein